jgi:ubiquinone/menaquinone biosynthesis C-methylase UbiE
MTPHRKPFAAGPRRRGLALALSATAVLFAAAPGLGQQQTGAPPKDINKPFDDPNVSVKEFQKKFETDSREVYARRAAIVAALGLKPGMAVADVGAGTGLFTRLIAEKVGPTGTVYAVDINPTFLKHIAEQSKRLGQVQVKTVRGTQATTNLPTASVELVFLCDTYHHLERPNFILSSIHDALRRGGHLVVVEFDREKAPSGGFVKKHIRADKSVFLQEITRAGFEPVATPDAPALTENFFAKFRRVEKPVGRRSDDRPRG